MHEEIFGQIKKVSLNNKGKIIISLEKGTSRKMADSLIRDATISIRNKSRREIFKKELVFIYSSNTGDKVTLGISKKDGLLGFEIIPGNFAYFYRNSVLLGRFLISAKNQKGGDFNVP